MPIEVDTSQAPGLLRYRYHGAFPPLDEQSLLRERLIGFGMLTAETRAIMDVRELEDIPNDEVLAQMVAARLQRGGWPVRRAYLIDTARHQHMIEHFRMTSATIAAFIDEAEAMRWLMP